MSRPKRPKSKDRSVPKDDEDLPLLSGSWRKVRANATAADPDDEVFDEEEIAPLQPEARRRPSLLRRLYNRHWNYVVGLALLPFCLIFTDAIFSAFSDAHAKAVRIPFWKSHEFLMFAGGAALWVAWFFLSVWIWREPRPLRVYVWCHEFMHAMVAKAFGGEVRKFEVTREGGHIITNRYNFLIALAPYIWPLPAVPVMAAWGIAAQFPEALYHREWFLAALGISWMFHVSFTLWMMPIGQTDFHGPGLTFSFALIYLVNVLLLTPCIIVLSPEVSFAGYWRELIESCIRFYGTILDMGIACFRIIAGK